MTPWMIFMATPLQMTTEEIFEDHSYTNPISKKVRRHALLRKNGSYDLFPPSNSSKMKNVTIDFKSPMK